VKKNLSSIIKQVVEDLNEFKQTSETKLKSANAFLNLLFIAESEISQFSDIILTTLHKQLFSAEEEICVVIRKAAEVFGLFVSCDLIVPLVLQKISELD